MAISLELHLFIVVLSMFGFFSFSVIIVRHSDVRSNLIRTDVFCLFIIYN